MIAVSQNNNVSPIDINEGRELALENIGEELEQQINIKLET